MSSAAGSALHAVVAYDARNSSVRARVVHWFRRVGNGTVHGPGFDSSPPPPRSTTIVLRNARRFTRGRIEQRLLGDASLGVYELDDGLPWDDGRLPDLGRWWKRPWRRSLVADRAARAADRMIVGNDVLAEWALSRCADVRVIPTCVEPSDYRQKMSYDVGARPTIGWIGSGATEHFLWSIAPALRRVHERHGAVVEVISGEGEIPGELATFVTRIPWTETVAAERLASWDVGVMPLKDGVYERAKCAYKLLQYAAAGVPAVGSPVGANAVVLARMNAPAPASLDDWVGAIDAVLTDSPSQREQRGARGRRVAAEFSYDRWEPAWRAAVELPCA